jgi:putative ABC transport system permease protein
MWRNRTGSVLIALQIALTLAIVVNCMFLAKNRIDFINRPSGMDVDNIIYAQSIGFGMDYEHDATIDADLRLLRDLPGVIAVSSTNQLPLSGSGNSNGFTAEFDEDAPRHSANTYTMNEDAIEALGVKLAAGRAFREEEVRRADHPELSKMAPQVIITQELADKLFDGEAAVGRLMYNGIGQAAEVVGVMAHMFGSWPSWEYAGHVVLYPERTDGTMTRYIIRTAPGERDALIPVIEKALADSNRTRIVRDVESMRDRMDRTYEGENAVAVTLTTAVILLLVVTGLGIVGLASFTVRQRTKQIGTRRAIGARKIDIIRYFLLENWLMTTIGIVLGTLLTIGVNYSLASAFDVDRLNYWYLVAGMFMLWLLGFLAVAEPARRASKVSPAIATRTV